MSAPILIVTDGSGHQDGNNAGGFAAIIRLPNGEAPMILYGAKTGTSVERMELEALLDALAWLVRGGYDANRPEVRWYCDRQTLVEAVKRDEWGEPVMARSRAAADLWARFECLEPLFRVTAIWNPRCHLAANRRVDALAGELRIMLRDFNNEYPHNITTTMLEELPDAPVQNAPEEKAGEAGT